MRRWARRFTLVALVAMASLAIGYPSAHADCPVLVAACRLGEAVGAGEGLVDDFVPPVDTPVDDKIGPVVAPIVDDVLDRVHDVLDRRPVDLPDPVDTRGRSGSHSGGPPTRVGDGLPVTPNPPPVTPNPPPVTPNPPPVTPNPDDHGGRGAVGGRIPDVSGPTSPPGPTISATSGTAPPGSVDRTSGNRFGEVLGGVARSLAIVLALFGLAVAFVAIQDRIDRSDPRLALAPVESDVVEFV